MNKQSHLLPILAAFLPFTGCTKKPVEVTGQIFVVTAGRENVKMGLVGVHVLTDEQFTATAAKIGKQIRDEVIKNAEYRANLGAGTALSNHFMSLETARLSVPELQTLKEQTAVLMSEVLMNLPAMEMTFEKSQKLLLSQLPPPVTRTDADGRFTITVQSKVWLIAHGERSTLNKTERYLWIMPYELLESSQAKPILISNDSDVDSLDTLYTLVATQSGMPTDFSACRLAEVNPKLIIWTQTATESAAVAVKEANERAAVAAKEAKDRETREIQTAMEKAAVAAKEAKDREAREKDLVALKRTEAKKNLITGIESGTVGRTLELPLSGTVSLRVIFCPAGSFTMGSLSSERGRWSDEDQVKVQLSQAFWMAKTEVTQSQWKVVMGSSPGDFTGADIPVGNVSWDDAQGFVSKLNQLGMVPAGWKFVLPTEAQWEYACRAGTSGPLAGSALDKLAWYADNSDEKAHPVATKAANA